jgi:2,4-dienoyl-CoA reductase-like NADH-dependent reductase (Old Yellow Enzyme family)
MEFPRGARFTSPKRRMAHPLTHLTHGIPTRRPFHLAKTAIVYFAKALDARGCSAIHVSSGGTTPAQQIPVGPSYQVPLARAVKAATNLPTIAVGLISGYDQAEAIVGTGDADLVAFARTMLYDPRWPWHAAAHLGATVKAPKQYLRSQPSRYRHLLEQHYAFP